MVLRHFSYIKSHYHILIARFKD